MRVLPVILALLFSVSTQAQRTFSVLEQPLFSTASDSVKYAQLNQIIREAMGQQRTLPDSLMEEFRAMRARITGYKRQYKSSPGFITLDSLKKLPDKSQVRQLSISNLKSRKLPAAVYSCPNLEELELVHTQIKNIKRLNRFAALTGLYILNNNPKGKIRIGKTKTVRTVVMRGDTPDLPGSFAPVVALERLDLAHNGISTFPKGLTRNKNLKQLILSNNAIVELKIPALPTLEKLELIRNKIEHIPESISNLSRLKQLTLNYNSINSVAPSISNLLKLEQLSFYQNKLNTIPDGVYSLPALREIDLYHNEIERVDKRIANLKQLEVLYLSHNRIISLPAELSSLTNLQELYLSDNRLVELPAGLNQLQNLKVLRVNNNRLVQAPVSVTNLIRLENLDISGNQINELPNGLDGLPVLKILVMMNNPWNETSRNLIPAITRTLRNKSVVVHIEERLSEN